MRKMLSLLGVLLSPLVYLTSSIFLAVTIAASMWVDVSRREKQPAAEKGERPFERWEKQRAFVEMKDLRYCSACSKWVRESFPTEAGYLELDLRIKQEAFAHLRTIPGGFTEPKYVFLGVGVGGRTFVGADIYACRACGQEWELSSPDLAYRGYFKPIEERTLS